ncbi:MAG: hypothetical protein AB1502_12015 [Thermodesulfobacteriota bacterium]
MSVDFYSKALFFKVRKIAEVVIVEAEQRKRIKDLSKEILFLSPTEQVYLSKLWVKGLKGNYSLVGRIADIWLKSWYGRTKSEEWMESRVVKDIKLKPKKLS